MQPLQPRPPATDLTAVLPNLPAEKFNWPGAYYGIREPDPKETPLSWSEVHHARRHGFLPRFD